MTKATKLADWLVVLDAWCTKPARFRRSQMRTAVESLNPRDPYAAVGHPPVEQGEHQVVGVQRLCAERKRHFTRDDDRQLVNWRIAPMDRSSNATNHAAKRGWNIASGLTRLCKC